MKDYMTESELKQSALRGLIILGRKKEEAVRELIDADRQNNQRQLDELWNSARGV